MDAATYAREVRFADAMGRLERPNYWLGYRRGLQRAFHGASFCTSDEHAAWLAMANDAEPARAEQGRGYRDGVMACLSAETAADKFRGPRNAA